MMMAIAGVHRLETFRPPTFRLVDTLRAQFHSAAKQKNVLSTKKYWLIKAVLQLKLHVSFMLNKKTAEYQSQTIYMT